MNATPHTIVVVEDDQETVVFLEDLFNMLGYQVVPCPIYTRALACIAEYQPSVVVLDVLLGGMTGVDVLHQLRDEPATRTIPVIFFTGSGQRLRQLLPDFAAHGASLVVKPNVEQLIVAVQQAAIIST